jgi:hypothetical protein
VKIVYVVMVVCFLLFHKKLLNKLGGMCYTTKCDTVEDSSAERASEGTLGG